MDSHVLRTYLNLRDSQIIILKLFKIKKLFKVNLIPIYSFNESLFYSLYYKVEIITFILSKQNTFCISDFVYLIKYFCSFVE